MSHFNFYKTEISNNQKFYRVWSRKMDDPRVVFNNDGTVSWKDHLDHASRFGGVVEKYKIVEWTYGQSKQICDQEKIDLSTKFTNFGFQEVPAY